MTRYITAAETGKLIRLALKAAFPGTKFSVRTDRGSARIVYTDGPALDGVKVVAEAFRGASFDPMIDLESNVYSELDGEAVHFGTKYVFVERRLSDAFLTTITDEINYAKADLFEVIAGSFGASLKFVGESFGNEWTEFLSMQNHIMRTAAGRAA